MTGDVGREDRARGAGGAEGTLREPPVRSAREDRPPVLELVDVARGLPGQDLDRVLVAEVVGALDRVEGVRLGVVVARVSERRVDAALGRTEWLLVGCSFETTPTSAPASCASMAARIPAQPAPTRSTSCLAPYGGRYRRNPLLRGGTSRATRATSGSRPPRLPLAPLRPSRPPSERVLAFTFACQP